MIITLRKLVGPTAFLVVPLAAFSCGSEDSDAHTTSGTRGAAGSSGVSGKAGSATAGTGGTGAAPDSGSGGGAGSGGTMGRAGASGAGGAKGDAGPPLDECAAAGSDVIFCDGFETPDTAPFWDGDDTAPERRVDPGPGGFAENHVIRLRVPAGRGGAGLWKRFGTAQDRAYLRFYLEWEPGYDFAAPVHGPGGLHGGTLDCLGCSGNAPTDWFTSTLQPTDRTPPTLFAYTYYRGMYMDCAGPGSCWGDMFPCTAGPSYCTNPAHGPKVTQPALRTGHWYCIEQMIDAGSPTASSAQASGSLDFWIDGLEVGPFGSLWMRSSADIKVSAVWLYLFHHEQHSVEGLLLDNVVVSKSRVGCF